MASIADEPVRFLEFTYFIYGLGRVIFMLEGLTIGSMQGNKLRWWPIFHEPEHELVGRVQLHISYSITSDENNYPKVHAVSHSSITQEKKKLFGLQLVCFGCFVLIESYL